MWEFRWQTGQRVASARASRRASMSVAGMSSSAAGCPSQSWTGSCRRVMWRRTGLGSIMGPSLLADCGFSLPGAPLDRQPPDVTPQPVQPPGRQGYGGATPVSGFAAFCLGQVYPRLRGLVGFPLPSRRASERGTAPRGDPGLLRDPSRSRTLPQVEYPGIAADRAHGRRGAAVSGGIPQG